MNPAGTHCVGELLSVLACCLPLLSTSCSDETDRKQDLQLPAGLTNSSMLRQGVDSGGSTSVPIVGIERYMEFTELPRSPGDSYFVDDLIVQNARVRDMLAHPQATGDPAAFNQEDKDAVLSIVSAVEGFMPESSLLVYTRYERFSVVWLPGTVDTNSVSVSVIHVPGHGWSLLGVDKLTSW